MKINSFFKKIKGIYSSTTGVSTDYQPIFNPSKKELEKYEQAWQNPLLPHKQLAIVQQQISGIKKTKKIGQPFKAAVDLIKQVEIKDPTVLEVGCSSGYYGEVLRLAGLKLRYEGCDYSKEFIKLAKRLYPKVKFKVTDATKLDYPEKSFSLVISGSCLLHILNYKKAIAESARVAKSYVLYHRTPIIHLNPTTYFKKKGYDVKMIEIAFNEEEFISLVRKSGFLVQNVIPYFSTNLNNFSEPIFWKSYLTKRVLE